MARRVGRLASGDEEREVVRRILVPLDLGAMGESKVPVAEEYARAFGAEVLLLHVLPRRGLDPDEVLPVEATARAYLDVVIAEMAAANVQASAVIRAGPVAAMIVDEAILSRADLIILGMNVRPRLRSAVLGSVADEVVRSAPCPVLLVRPEPGGFDAPALRNFSEDAERAGPLQPRPVGARTIGVNRIIGSVGRAHELGPDFRPLGQRRADDERFARIKAALEAGASLPPVELYKLGYGYYVLDGHRRVAAAQQVGQREVDAEVTEFVPLGDPRAARLSAERRAFERSTGLTDVEATRPETYVRLAELIDAHRAEHGIDDYRRAAQHWRNAVYHPLWQHSRERDLTRHFPGERTADLIARAETWRAAANSAERQALGREAALDQFAATHLGGRDEEDSAREDAVSDSPSPGR